MQAALDELRGETGNERVDLGELVVLGARSKLAVLRAERADDEALRRRLADRIRARQVPVDRDAAQEVRTVGWVRS